MLAMNTADLGLPVDVPSTALFTDQYELTMLQAALKAGTAERRSVFEVFTRRLPEGRRYGVLAGTGRVLDAVENFRFDADVLGFLRERGIVDEETSTGSPDTASRVTSGVTPRARSTSPAPPSCGWRAPSPSACCWRP